MYRVKTTHNLHVFVTNCIFVMKIHFLLWSSRKIFSDQARRYYLNYLCSNKNSNTGCTKSRFTTTRQYIRKRFYSLLDKLVVTCEAISLILFVRGKYPSGIEFILSTAWREVAFVEEISVVLVLHFIVFMSWNTYVPTNLCWLVERLYSRSLE